MTITTRKKLKKSSPPPPKVISPNKSESPGFMSQMLGTLTQGFAFGGGSGLAHQAIDSVFGKNEKQVIVNESYQKCDHLLKEYKLFDPVDKLKLTGKYEILEEMPPFLGGGDMIDIVKINQSTYADPPLRFEAGTPPIVEAIALGEAIDWVVETDIDRIGKHEKNVISYGMSVLTSIEGVNIFGTAPNKTGVISFTMDCAHSHDIATIIDREGVAVRAGHHCAQPLMDAFNLVSTTRASVGAYSSNQDFDKLGEALTKVKKIFGV